MIDKIIESLESMAEDMRAMGDVEEASGVDSALWLIEEMTKQADTPQTDCDKCIWSVCNYNKVEWDADTPQTEEVSKEYKRGRLDALSELKAYIREMGTYGTADTPQTDCSWR